MERTAERPYLRLVRTSDEERDLRLRIQDLMVEKNASAAYVYPDERNIFRSKRIFFDEILYFPMSFSNLEQLEDELEVLPKYNLRDYPPTINLDEELIRLQNLRLMG